MKKNPQSYTEKLVCHTKINTFSSSLFPKLFIGLQKFAILVIYLYIPPKNHLARVTVKLDALGGVVLAEDGLVNGHGLGGALEVLEGHDLVVVEAAHVLVSGVAVGTEEVGAVGAARDRVLHGLAGGAQHRGRLDGVHVQDVGEDVVAGQRGRALGAHARHLATIGTGQDHGLGLEVLVEAGLAEDVEAGEHPGRAELVGADAALLVLLLGALGRLVVLQAVQGAHAGRLQARLEVVQLLARRSRVPAALGRSLPREFR